MKLFIILLSVSILSLSCIKEDTETPELRREVETLRSFTYEQALEVSRLANFIKSIGSDTTLYINGDRPLYLGCFGGGATLNVYVTVDSVYRTRKKD